MLSIILGFVITTQGKEEDYTSERYIVSKLESAYRERYNEILSVITNSKDQEERKYHRSLLDNIRANPISAIRHLQVNFRDSKVGDIGTFFSYKNRVVKRSGKSTAIMELDRTGIYFAVKNIDTSNMAAGSGHDIPGLLVYSGIKSIDGYNDLRVFYSVPNEYINQFVINIKDGVAKQEAMEKKEKAESSQAMKFDKAKKDASEYEEKAAELLKHAKRWLSEGNKELAIVRLKDLLKRFPDSKVAGEAKKMLDGIK